MLLCMKRSVTEEQRVTDVIIKSCLLAVACENSLFTVVGIFSGSIQKGRHSYHTQVCGGLSSLVPFDGAMVVVTIILWYHHHIRTTKKEKRGWLLVGSLRYLKISSTTMDNTMTNR
jgi:hypothetical protein